MPEENLKELLSRTPSADKWLKAGMHKRAGVLAPLFSVYSKNSTGIGDFRDLNLLIDWVRVSGNSILQLLPLNELGSLFCPYDSISSFALEPAYISLEELPATSRPAIKARIKQLKEEFPPGKPHIDYKIKRAKLDLLWAIFLSGYDDLYKEAGAFCADNSYWLEDFALFKAIRDFHAGAPWYEWEDKYKYRNADALKSFRRDHDKEVLFHIWVQQVLYKQLKDAKRYAASKNILLKGDLPLLVSRDSADVWAHPEFFKLDFASGAPPDMYCAKGQRWGMPTYNWERVAADGYGYLKEKLKAAQEFYDILRIDHVVGIFRIWSIPWNEPQENQGLNGSFDPRDENKWEKHGRDILSVMLQSTKMILCAEDLGVIPKICPQVLGEFGIPGNDVQRWTKDWNVKHDFLPPSDYRGLSVTMLSTHDTTNWPAWWENEAGTVDEALFIRKCSERGIDYSAIKKRLFDAGRSRHGRLRWLDKVSSPDILVSVLGKKKDEVTDFIDMYVNTYAEKNKLWKQLRLPGEMRESADKQAVEAALKLSLDTRAVFSVQLMIDWLYLSGIFKGDPYGYRINTPGSISSKNWSLTMPLPLEGLVKLKINSRIKKMVSASGRR
ncbi:MAG: 4-alpha-glucanotransferase [Candidatus Omnitrophota bacterium]|jgi:4-alpha-glucanotransferase